MAKSRMVCLCLNSGLPSSQIGMKKPNAGMELISFLLSGDTVRLEIQYLGIQRNTVAQEKD